MYHVIALYHENIVLLTIRKRCFGWKLIAFKELNVHHIELLWVQGKVEGFPSEGYSLDVTELPMHFLGHLGSLFPTLQCSRWRKRVKLCTHPVLNGQTISENGVTLA